MIEQEKPQSSRQKRQTVPNTGHGINYQIHRLMSVALVNALVKDLNFELLTEDTTYGDFDDIVFITDSGIYCTQIKHRANGGSGAGFSDFVTENGNNKELMLYKYYDSIFERLNDLPTELELFLLSNEKPQEDFQSCLTENGKFTEAFYQAETPVLLLHRNLIIASLYKYSKHRSDSSKKEEPINEKNLACFLMGLLKENQLTKKNEKEIKEFIVAVFDCEKTISSSKIIECLSEIEKNGLNDEQHKTTLIKILKENSYKNSGKFKLYELASIERDISQYPTIENFLRKLTFQFGESHVSQLEQEIKEKLKEYFKTTNDAIYHAFFHEFYLWLISPEAKSLDKLRVKELFDGWYGQYIHLERLCGATKSKLTQHIKRMDNHKIFERKKEIFRLDDFIKDPQGFFMVLHGEPGMGKSSLITKTFNKNKQLTDGEWIFIDWNDYLTLTQGGVHFDINNLHTLQVIVIDHAESVSKNPQHRETLTQLQLACNNSNKKLILLLSTDAYELLKDICEPENCEEVRMEKLCLDDVVNTYPHLKDVSQVSDILGNLVTTPFYLRLIVEHYQMFREEHLINMNADEIKEYLIQLEIEVPEDDNLEVMLLQTRKYNQSVKQKITLLSKMAFESLTQNEVISTVPPRWHELANTLVKQHFLLKIRQGQYVFTHSLYYEWSIFRYIDKEFNFSVEIHDSLEQFLKLPSLHYLQRWFKKQPNLLLSYLKDFSYYTALNQSTCERLVLLLHAVDFDDLNSTNKSILSQVLSELWLQCVVSEKKLTKENATQLFNGLLQMSEFFNGKILKSIRILHKYSDYNCPWYVSIMKNAILESSIGADTFCQYYPKEALELFKKICILSEGVEAEENLYRSSTINCDFGLKKEYANNEFYPSAFSGPFWSILRHHDFTYFQDIIEIINQACLRYRKIQQAQRNSPFQSDIKSDFDEDIVEIEFIQKKGNTIKLFGNTYLWSLYRNTGNCVKPSFVQAALMAIELWLFNLAENLDSRDYLFQALDILIVNSKTVATIAVVASLCIRYPEELAEYALSLFKIKQFYSWDRHRRVHDGIGLLLDPFICSSKAKIFREERKITNGRFNRKVDLEALTLDLQIRIESQRLIIQAILDTHYRNLPLLSERTEENHLWKLVLSRMDYRKVKWKHIGNNLLSTEIQHDDDTLNYLERAKKDNYDHDFSSNVWMSGQKLYENKNDSIRLEYDINNLINNCIRHKDYIASISEPILKAEVITGQCYLACAALRYHNTQLSEENHQWCFNIIINEVEKVKKSDDGIESSVMLSDGKVPIAETLPFLLVNINQDDPNWTTIKENIIFCLTHSSRHLRTLISKSIGLHIWNCYPKFAEQCLIAMIELFNINAAYHENYFRGNQLELTLEYKSKIAQLRESLLQEQLNSSIPEFLLTSTYQSACFLDSWLNNIIISALLIASENVDNILSKDLFKAYLNTAIKHQFKHPDIEYGIYHYSLGKYLLKVATDELDIYIKRSIEKKDNYELLTWILDDIISTMLFDNFALDTEKFWYIWNFVLSVMQSKESYNLYIARVLFSPLAHYFKFDSRYLENYPDYFYQFLLKAQKFIEKINVAKFNEFLLRTELLINHHEVFQCWLSLAAHASLNFLMEILDFVKKHAPRFKEAQDSITIFLLILYKKNYLIANNIREAVLTIISMLDDTDFLSKFRADIQMEVLKTEVEKNTVDDKNFSPHGNQSQTIKRLSEGKEKNSKRQKTFFDSNENSHETYKNLINKQYNPTILAPNNIGGKIIQADNTSREAIIKKLLSLIGEDDASVKILSENIHITREEIAFSVEDKNRYYTADLINLLLHLLGKEDDSIIQIYPAIGIDNTDEIIEKIQKQEKVFAFVPLFVAYDSREPNHKNHWVALIVDKKNRLIFYLDPAQMTNSNINRIQGLFEYSKSTITNPINFQRAEQDEGWVRYCGAYAVEIFLQFAETIKKGQCISGALLSDVNAPDSISLEVALSPISCGEAEDIANIRKRHIEKAIHIISEINKIQREDEENKIDVGSVTRHLGL